VDESFDARRALYEAAQQGRLPWSAGGRAIRKSLGLTQAEFAQAFELTVRQVSELETGAANPTVGTLARLAKPLGLTIGFIPTPTS
jgi:DNA-binding XRE family transcriptional regulator